ncbi:MAG: hypothetical protein ACYDDO_15360 [Acidiferrobacterales bacterium]
MSENALSCRNWLLRGIRDTGKLSGQSGEPMVIVCEIDQLLTPVSEVLSVASKVGKRFEEKMTDL